VIADWRLRECDYVELNRAPAGQVHTLRSKCLTVAYLGAQSWTQAVRRVGRCLGDLPTRWEGQRFLVVGHLATQWAFAHLISGGPLEELVDADFGSRAGWQYRLRST